MSQLIFNSHSWIHSPQSLENFGGFVLNNLGKERFESFLCFLQSEDSLYVYPELPRRRLRKVVSQLLQLDWTARPRDTFLKILESSGHGSAVELGTKMIWRWIQPEGSQKPLGAIAYVLKPGEEDPFAQQGSLIESFAQEIISCNKLVQRFSQIANDSDYIFSSINRIGCLLLQRASRPQLLAALVDLAIYLSRSEVGALLVKEPGGGYQSEVELGFDPDLVQRLQLIPGNETVLESLERTGRAVVIDDVSGPTIKAPREFTGSIKALTMIPIFSNDAQVGVLCLASGEAGKDVSTNELKSLETLSAVISLAIENEILTQKVAEGFHQGEESWGFDRFIIQNLLDALPNAVLLGNDRGKWVYQNKQAKSLLKNQRGVKKQSVDPQIKDWFENHWRKCPTKDREVLLPFQSSEGLAMVVSTQPLSIRVGLETHVFYMSSLELSATNTAENLKYSPETLRISLGKIRLGVDLLTRWATRLNTDSDVERFNASRKALVRSISHLERHLDDGTESVGEDFEVAEKSIDFFASFDAALDKYQVEQPLRAWHRPVDWPQGQWVRAHSEKLENALFKILSTICSSASIDKMIKISVMEDADQLILAFDFESVHIEVQEDLMAQLDSGRPNAISGFPGLVNALHYIQRIEGTFVGAGHPEGYCRLELALPITEAETFVENAIEDLTQNDLELEL